MPRAADPPTAPADSEAAGPKVRIVEEPASNALRFRYECEGRSAGSIPGENSTADKKTYPTIEIVGYKGRAVVVVSCVTKEKPHRTHPHNIVGRENCAKGVCTVEPDLSESSLVTFSNLGIQCVKRKGIVDSLKQRQSLKIDPFKTGYDHINQTQSIDLNAVRLCFQVFLPNSTGGYLSLRPVTSQVIYDKKAVSVLQISRVSRCSGSARGGTEMIILCEKVSREDTAVVFVERDEKNEVVWEAAAGGVVWHKQVAAAFTAPPYRDPRTAAHRTVQLQLKRLSDNGRSNAVPFEYIPDTQDMDYLKNKRRKIISPFLQSTYDQPGTSFMQEQQQVKPEPRDKTPPHFMSSPPPHQPYTQPRQDNTYEQWGMQMEQNLLHTNWTGANYGAPLQQTMNMSPISSGMASPQHITMLGNMPSMQTPMDNMQMSPMGAMSPMAVMPQQSPSYMDQMMGQPMPNMGQISPNMGQISPNMMQPNMEQQMPQASVDTHIVLNSGELRALLDDPMGLNDSLNRLSTSELLKP